MNQISNSKLAAKAVYLSGIFLVFILAPKVLAGNYNRAMFEKCLRIITREKFDGIRLQKVQETALSLKSKKQRDQLEEAMHSFIQEKSHLTHHDFCTKEALETFQDVLKQLKSFGLSEGLELQDDQEILQKYLSLFSAESIRPSKAKKIKQAVMTMEDPQAKQQIQDAIRCFIIKQACDIEEDPQKEEVAQIFTDRELLSTKLSRQIQLVGLGKNTFGLPNEAIGHVFDYLESKDLCSAALTCKDWYAPSKESIDATAFEELLKKKDDKNARKLLQRKALSPEELDKVWNTFVKPIIRKEKGVWNRGWICEELGEYCDLFAKQLLRLIHNKNTLNTHFEWILQSIKKIKHVWIQRILLTQVCAHYQGGEDRYIDLIFEIIETSLSTCPMARNSVIAAIAQNTELLNKHFKRICEGSQMNVTYGPRGVIERFKTIARHYTGDPQLLLDYADKQYTLFVCSFWGEAYSIYKGLLMNEKLGAQCYPILVKKNVVVGGSTGYICTLDYSNCLIRHYIAGHSEELLNNILTTEGLIKNPTRKLTFVTNAYETLVTRVQYHAAKGNKQVEDELQAVSHNLALRYPLLLTQGEALSKLQKETLSLSEIEEIWDKHVQFLPFSNYSKVSRAFLKYLRGFIANPGELNANYERISQIIIALRDKPEIWETLMSDLVEKYQGNNIDPILNAIRNPPRLDNYAVERVAKKGNLTQGNIDKLIAPSLSFSDRFYLNLAKFYTGPGQDILNAAKKVLDRTVLNPSEFDTLDSIMGNLLLGLLKNQSLSEGDYKTAMGLLMGPYLREKYYYQVANQFNDVKSEYKENLIMDLIEHYLVGRSQKLHTAILSYVDSFQDPERINILKKIYGALNEKAKYRVFGSNGNARRELKGIANTLETLYPDVKSKKRKKQK